MKTKIQKWLLLLLLMIVGLNDVWGQDTTIADIDFSNPISGGVAAGRVNTMTIGSHANNPTTISDGRLILGKTENTVVIPELQRDGNLVRLTFEIAFGNLVNRYANFYLRDAVGNDIAYFSYNPYNGILTNNLGLSTTDLHSDTPTNWSNRVSFTIILKYYSNQITTQTSVNYTDHTLDMTNL